MILYKSARELKDLLGIGEPFAELQGIEVVINRSTGKKITINYRRGRSTSKLPRKLKKRITRNRCAHVDWREYCMYQYSVRLDRLFQPLVSQLEEMIDADCLHYMQAEAVAHGC